MSAEQQQMLPLTLDIDENDAEIFLRWAAWADDSRSNAGKHDHELIAKIFGVFPNLKREWEFLLS